MKPIFNRPVLEIEERGKAVGAVTIQVPFKELEIVIDVWSLLLKEHIPTLPSMKDMIDNDLGNFVQGDSASKWPSRHLPSMEDYFLILDWEPVYTNFASYNKKELRRIHCSLGHPSVKGLEIFLWLEVSPAFDTTTVKAIEKIQEESNICAEFLPSPQRFNFTVGPKEPTFHYRVQLDTVFLSNQAVIYVVDEVIHFCAA